MNIQIGTMVSLISGSPVMTVEFVYADDETVKCVWFEEEYSMFRTYILPKDILQIHKPKGEYR